MRLEGKFWQWLSQTLNALSGHDADECLCSRAHREKWGHKIDRFLGQGHCRAVWTNQQERIKRRT